MLFIKNKKTVLALLALTSVIIFIIYKYKNTQHLLSSNNNEDLSAATVAVAKAKTVIWHQQLNVVGSVKAQQGIMVSAQVSGIVEHINFFSGQIVKAGDVLLTLENSDEQATLENAQAKLLLTQSNYQRYAKLYNKKIIAPADLDTVRSQWQQAQAAVHQAQSLLNQKIIKAPFSGVLGINQINLGEYLAAGQAMVSLQTLTPVFIDFSVAEKFIQQVQVGTVIKPTTNSYPGQTFSGKIIAVDPAIDINTRSMNVRAEVSNQDRKLWPGMFVNVQLPLGQANSVLVVPQTAISYSPDGAAIFVVQNNKVFMRNVQVIAREDDLAAVSGAIKSGDLVVVAGQLNLYDGALIKINNVKQ